MENTAVTRLMRRIDVLSIESKLEILSKLSEMFLQAAHIHSNYNEFIAGMRHVAQVDFDWDLVACAR